LNEENLARVRAWQRSPRSADNGCHNSPSPWALRNPVVTCVLLGASSVDQLDENLDALDNLDFTDEELKRIDQFAVESGVDLWRRPATDSHILQLDQMVEDYRSSSIC